MVDVQYEQRVRRAAMDWLWSRDPTRSRTFGFDELRTFTFDGVALPLMDRQRGIRKPAQLTAALSIRTTFTSPGERPPYDDAVGSDGLPATSTEVRTPATRKMSRSAPRSSNGSR